MDFQQVTESFGPMPADFPSAGFTTSFHPTLSVDKIRSIRQAFEQESEYLEESLGARGHRTLMMTMYETTEHFLNKRINDFDVVEHLELLKVTAQELHGRGLSHEEFQSELMRESQNSVFKILQKV